MSKKGCVGAASVLAALSGVAYGGSGDQPVGPRGSAWLYPEIDFQDGRSRETDGRVWPEEIYGHSAGGDPEDLGPFAACFAEGYVPTPEQWASLNASLADGYDSRYNAAQRWSGGSAGSPINLSWSFVPDGTTIIGGTGGNQPSNLFARMDQLFGAANRATWINQFISVFNRWQALSGVNYNRAQAAGVDWDNGAAWGTAGNDTTIGDIRIGMKNIDGGSGILAYNSFPDSGDMVMDNSENWASGSPNYVFTRNTISHEHGHGLGFAHVCPIANTKLMEPFLSTAFDGPRHDELRAVHDFYGDPNESNNTSAAATALGTLASPSTTTVGAIPTPAIGSSSLVSLHGGDSDYYSLALAAPRLVNITVTPNGTTYTDLDQNGDGSCQTTPTNNTNSLAITNLNLIAYQSNGTTELRNQNATAAGSAETITGLLMANTTNFVRVTGATSGADTQCYTLVITVTNTNIAPSATDGTFSDKVRVTWPAIPDATGYAVMRNTIDGVGGITTLQTVAGNVTTYDDTTAAPGTTYYYFIRCQQTGNTQYRYTTLNGDPGFRGAANQVPTADAGPDQVAQDADGNLTETVTLNGSASTDPDGTITNYWWQEGAVTLASSASPTANVNLAAGVHNITLTVTDNSTGTDTDDVVVTVNRRPVANAGPDAVVDDLDGNGSEGVTLDGSGSSDPDGTIANYLWMEGAVTLANGPTANPTVALGWGVHTITLTVTDNLGGISADTATITVNRKPVANAGPDQGVTDTDNSGSESVLLDGSGSNDPDGSITNYLWMEGAATLANGPSPTANVLLPVGPHTITLTVTDNRNSTATDTVEVVVSPPAVACDGDVNCDGNLDGFDVEVMERATGGDLSDFCQADPDFNHDGNLDGFDVEAVETVTGGGPCP